MFCKYVTVFSILFLFSSGYKGYNFVYFVLVIWCCLGIISYEFDIIFLGGLASCLFFLSRVWITIWNNLHIFFLNDLFSWKFLKNRKHKTFRLRKYVNVLCLPTVNTVTVLYAFYKYLFSLTAHFADISFFACLVNGNSNYIFVSLYVRIWYSRIQKS